MGVIIMGGEFRGRKLGADTRAGVIRPTSGKVREALFSSLSARVPGSAFADLYAGTGAVGLEALSRGASEVTLVESHPQSWALLKSNVEAVAGGREEASRVKPVRADALAFCREQAAKGRRFDVVFADPPFDRAAEFAALPGLLLGILAEGGVAVVQFPTRTPPPWLDRVEKLRKYGESTLAYLPAGGF
jgi:16S rRNA (guanine(966)-N(2))-methyltransferase RsmD